MAKSRRKAGGATSGRYKPKKMGKGWSSYRSKLGFRPPAAPPANAAATKVSKTEQEPTPDSE